MLYIIQYWFSLFLSIFLFYFLFLFFIHSLISFTHYHLSTPMSHTTILFHTNSPWFSISNPFLSLSSLYLPVCINIYSYFLPFFLIIASTLILSFSLFFFFFFLFLFFSQATPFKKKKGSSTITLFQILDFDLFLDSGFWFLFQTPRQIELLDSRGGLWMDSNLVRSTCLWKCLSEERKEKKQQRVLTFNFFKFWFNMKGEDMGGVSVEQRKDRVGGHHHLNKVHHVKRLIAKKKKASCRRIIRQSVPKVPKALQELFLSCRETFKGPGTIPSPQHVQNLCHILGTNWISCIHIYLLYLLEIR